jgi:glycosyltransferase involved in cell wall biosynthesis
MKKKIILYTIDCRLDAGGAPRSTLILAKEMSKEFEVYILMPETDENRVIDSNSDLNFIQLHQFKDSFPFFFLQPFKALRFVWEVRKVLKNLSPDIIHAQMPYGARAIGLLKRLGVVKTPAIYTEREFVVGVRKIYQWFNGVLIAKPYERIVCLSNKAKSFWLKYRDEGISVIPNPGGKDFDVYSEEQYLLAKENISSFNPKNLNIVFVGRYYKTKRWELAEEIITQYAIAGGGNAHFYIALLYKQEDKLAVDFVKRVSAFNNVTVYSNVDTNVMNDLYYISDMHLITSSIESFGRTAIEAMARKCVVYSTDAGAISETIGFPNHILLPDANSFVQVIHEAENDRKKLDSIREMMFDRYKQLYTTSSNTNAYRVIYCDMIH